MRPGPIKFFRQSLKSESYFADELVNIYLLRPLAAIIVWVFYPTRVTPNQLTVAATLIGFASSLFYLSGTPAAVAVAGSLVLAKDIFDDADGQLARAKKMYSRRGRFLDSIGDFIVDIALFTAITLSIYKAIPSLQTILLGALAFIGLTLRVSYHVFYQVSFFHLEDKYKLNRIKEEITEEDRHGDPVALMLQKIFNLIYAWQDRMMYRIDSWCKGDDFDEGLVKTWYGNKLSLRISGLLGFGTEFTLLAVFSWMNELYGYLLFNVFVMNGIWIGSVLFRKLLLAKKLR